MRTSAFLLPIVLLIICTATVQARIINVPGDSTTIQGGINGASTGDTVMVHPGTYFEQDIDFLGKAITVMSINPGDSTVVASTIVNANGMERVFKFHNDEDTNSVLTGLTIMRGRATYGGGIRCFYASPTISNNKIWANSATGEGGGILCSHASPVISGNTITGNHATYGSGISCINSSSPLIIDNIIKNNVADYGGGMHCSESSPTVSGNTISDNEAIYGSGINCVSSSSIMIEDNSINNNEAEQGGGGIRCLNSSPTISGNTISDNWAFYGGGISCYFSNPVIRNNTITGNQVYFDQVSDGAGIFCELSSPTITENTISFNVAGWEGGGIYARECSSLVITGNTITDNRARDSSGGGINVQYSSAVISLNTISRNWTPGGGGGIMCLRDTTVVIDGNTITENIGWVAAAGVNCVGSITTISNNIISDNSGPIGGIGCNNSTALITGNLITDNYAGYGEGGGIGCQGNQSPGITIRDNIIVGNLAGYGGGGISLYNYCYSPLVEGNLIANNIAGYYGGGGIQARYHVSNGQIINNTIVGNSSTTRGGAIFSADSHLNVINTICWGNSAPNGPELGVGTWFGGGHNLTVSYSDIRYGEDSVYVGSGCSYTWGEGNIDADPRFVDPDSSDYNLQSDSPCIDTGDPSSPNVPWGGWRRDMGVHEYDQGFYYNGNVIIRKPVEIEPHHMVVP
jgi:parallel beta-helix repeat protein